MVEWPARDAPQVELVRRWRMEPVDGVPPVHHSRADEEHVVDGFGRQGAERGGIIAVEWLRSMRRRST